MYKESKYNYFIKYEDRIICFNGITGKIFAVKPNEQTFIRKQLSVLSDFERDYPEIFQNFKEWGFIVNADRDEVDILRLRNRMGVVYDRNYRLIINPTMDCNFNCWYCYQEHTKDFMSEEVVNKVKQHVSYMVDTHEIASLAIDWFGGEPLLYFDEVVFPLSFFSKNLSEKANLPFTSAITTNAYLIDEKRVQKFAQINLKYFQITIDGDEKRHNKIRNVKGKPTFDTIMNNIVLLCTIIPDVHITLRVNYDDTTFTKGNFEGVLSSIPENIRQNIEVNFHRVWQTFKVKCSAEDELTSLIGTARKLGYKEVPLSVNYKAGKTHICYVDKMLYNLINYDGKVYKCTARDLKEENVAGEITENGDICYKNGLLEKMFAKATFENPMCIKCKHVPICMGPCSQRLIEVSHDKLEEACSLRTAEYSIDKYITDLYLQTVKQKEKVVV